MRNTPMPLHSRFAGRADAEFNLRHDWNSLLDNEEVRPITERTKERWPPADTLVEYLSDFAQVQVTAGRIRFNTSVAPHPPRSLPLPLLLDDSWHMHASAPLSATRSTLVLSTVGWPNVSAPTFICPLNLGIPSPSHPLLLYLHWHLTRALLRTSTGRVNCTSRVRSIGGCCGWRANRWCQHSRGVCSDCC